MRTLRLTRALFEVVDNALPSETLKLVIDDTLVLRQSGKAPGSTIRHDHAKKSNRPQFLLAQCWVTLGVSVLGSAGRKHVLPIVSRSVPATGNRNKVTIALALVRSLAPVKMNKPVRLLFDAWFMRARLILPLLSRKMQIIVQVRYDAALFMPPDVLSRSRRGRPRTYGIKMTPDAMLNLPLTEVKLTLYGKEQLVRLRTVVAILWQQKRTVLELWMQIRSTAWTLVQLLSLVAEEAFPVEIVAPWRNKRPLTGDLVTQWLRMEFTALAFRDGFNRKSSIFTCPKQRGDPRLRV